MGLLQAMELVEDRETKDARHAGDAAHHGSRAREPHSARQGRALRQRAAHLAADEHREDRRRRVPALDAASRSAASRPSRNRLHRIPELTRIDAAGGVVEANRCLYCFDAPCAAACPTHIDVPRFIKKIATGNPDGLGPHHSGSEILGLSARASARWTSCAKARACMHRYNEQPIEIGRLQRHAMDTSTRTPERCRKPPRPLPRKRGLHRRGSRVSRLRRGTARARGRGHHLRQAAARRRPEHLRSRRIQVHRRR